MLFQGRKQGGRELAFVDRGGGLSAGGDESFRIVQRVLKAAGLVQGFIGGGELLQ
jgi:hypothetical protein